MVSGVALLLLVTVAPGFSQPRKFDVASVKPSKPGDDSSSWHTRPGYVNMKNQTLKSLVGIAYSVTDGNIAGGPRWVGVERFDVEARAASPAKDPELLLMMQELLAERFRLVVHRATTSSQGYVLVLAKSGLKISPDKTEGKSEWNGGRGKIVAKRISMTRFAESLTRMLGMPVVSLTDTKELYTFSLEWTPDNPPAAALDGVIPEAAAGPTLFTVIAEELGLKLESKKLPTEIIVIDKAERLTEN